MNLLATILLLTAATPQNQQSRIEVSAKWLQPEFALPTINCANDEDNKMRITSGPLSGMELAITPHIGATGTSEKLTLNFEDQSVSTVFSGDHVLLTFQKMNNGKLQVSIDSGKPHGKSFFKLGFWQDLDGDKLDIQVRAIQS